MHMLNILANVSDQSTASQFLKDKEYNDTKYIREQMSATQSRYYNPISPLADAQKAADNYMLMKQRKPMVIEYYKAKPTSNNATEFIESVEMYINPQRLNVQYQKVKGKAYTRGGIFYHHWGDDNPIMSLSGTVGYAGMKGIEQLERIYLNSGALLKYGHLDLNRVNNGVSGKYRPIDLDNLSGIISSVISDTSGVVTMYALDGIDQKIKDAKTSTDKKQYEIVKQVVLNIKNIMKQSEYQDAYKKINSDIAKEAMAMETTDLRALYGSAQYKINSNKTFQNLDMNTRILMAFDIALPYLFPGDKSIWSVLDKNQLDSIVKDITPIGFINSIISTIMGLSSDIITRTYDIVNEKASRLNDYIVEINKANNAWKIDRDESFEGWSDIADEVFDEYRPRLIFIYFEDRVYLGHFDSFNYSRVAETTLINYEMRFTIVRQIIMSKVGSKPTNLTSRINNYLNQLDPSTYTTPWLEQYQKDKFKAYLRILKRVTQLTLSNSIYRARLELDPDVTDYALSLDEVESITGEIRQLQPLALEWATLHTTQSNESLDYYKDMINATNYSAKQLLEYFALRGQEGVAEEVQKEYKRIYAVYRKELTNNTLTDIRLQQIVTWLRQVYETSNVEITDVATRTLL